MELENRYLPISIIKVQVFLLQKRSEIIAPKRTCTVLIKSVGRILADLLLRREKCFLRTSPVSHVPSSPLTPTHTRPRQEKDHLQTIHPAPGRRL